MDNLIIVGSGGHALASAEIIESLNKFNIVGLVDSKNTNIHSQSQVYIY